MFRAFAFGENGLGHVLQIPNNSSPGKCPEKVVSDVEFPPIKTLARRGHVAVVIVMPAFAKRDDRENEAVARIVVRLEAALAHQVGHRVDAGRAVEKGGGADEEAPNEKLPPIGVKAGSVVGEETADAQNKRREKYGYDDVKAVQENQLRKLREVFDLGV